MAKILLVDDYPDIRKILALLLANRGHEIIEAGDGQEAVRLAQEQMPDLILMDMSLPIMSGWEATHEIKSADATREIPVIALTAHAMRGDRERAWEAGCDGFITKPIDDELLEHTIEQVLAERQGEGGRDEIVTGDLELTEQTRRRQEKVLRIHNEQVLIVNEDEKEAAETAAELKAHGYRTTIARNVEQALALIEDDLPDLIICDIELPEKSGYDFAARIKKTAKLPFVPLILAAEGQIDWEKGLESGADDFIAKPHQTGELLVRVRSLTRLKRAIAMESSRADELASVLSQMVTGLIIADADETISVVNGRGLEILGVDLDDVIGGKIEELLSKLKLSDPECDPYNLADFPLTRALKNGETLTKMLVCAHKRDGKNMMLRFNAAPIYNERGQKTGAVSIFEDVTEEVSRQRQLEDYRRELEATNQRLSAAVESMSRAQDKGA